MDPRFLLVISVGHRPSSLTWDSPRSASKMQVSHFGTGGDYEVLIHELQQTSQD